MFCRPAAFVVAIAAAFVFTACGQGLVDKKYEGDPLARVPGVVQSQLVSVDEELHAYLGWVDNSGTTQAQLVTRAELTGDGFPAHFEIELYDEPPASTGQDIYGKSSIAQIVVCSAETEAIVEDVAINHNSDVTIAPDAVIGMSESYLLFVRDVAAAQETIGVNVQNPDDIHLGFMLFQRNQVGADCLDPIFAAENDCLNSNYDDCFAQNPDDEDGTLADACVNERCSAEIDAVQNNTCELPTKVSDAGEEIVVKLTHADGSP